MEKEAECQTEANFLLEGIKLSENLTDILVAYAKNVILHDPTKNYDDIHTKKKCIYEWSKEYFKKLYDENKENNGEYISNQTSDDYQKFNLNRPTNEIKSTKLKIKEEMEKMHFNMQS
ncbi:conserved protein, unknown function [Hepatocystis sp. ex Piliocolobus tephrosceles]|nr:conserved protein, unknown function [Hepatocystis sp. ex Piliocolobus tephrosceles]